eukprot:3289931-Prymnesium_polylepis.2
MLHGHLGRVELDRQLGERVDDLVEQHVARFEHLSLAAARHERPRLGRHDTLPRLALALGRGDLHQRLAGDQKLPAIRDATDVERVHAARADARVQPQEDPLGRLVVVELLLHRERALAGARRRHAEARERAADMLRQLLLELRRIEHGPHDQ